MNRRAIRLCHLRGLRSSPVARPSPSTAVGAGVGLVVGIAIATQSLTRSLGSFSTAIGGEAPFRVEGTVDHGGLDGATLPKIAAVDGVRAAVPMILSITEVVDRAGDTHLVPVLGVDCTVEAITGGFGCTPTCWPALRRSRARAGAGDAARARAGRCAPTSA